ncbi:MAG: PLP-dependent aminotransferase family protein [Calditrichaeota bacterium]|nr:MAG: PLP-dependent aminotransferase family protein [Calditrichota bacterium]
MIVDDKEKVRTDMWKIAPHVLKLEASIIREILKISSKPGVINFAGGLPAPELFPIKDLTAATNRAIENYGEKVFQYSLSMGVVELRELIAERASRRGTKSGLDNILITTGAQQAIELVARAFIDPGDYILTENPTYLGALQAFNYYRAKYTSVEMDHEGMIIDQVEDHIKKFKPKLIYTVSNFQNPTGITMSEQRRRDLVVLAKQYDLPIIDDNPYGDIRFSGKRVPTLKSIGGDEVIALRTFSKIISPGLRIGWMNGPVDILKHFEKVKQCTDLHSSTFNQYVIYEYLKAGHLEPHIDLISKDYGAKRDVMIKAMEEHFPEGITWTHPEGGLFLWVELPKNMSAKELLPKAIDLKVAYVYGQPFFPSGEGENTLRLNYCNATHDNIREGIKRLGTLFKENM